MSRILTVVSARGVFPAERSACCPRSRRSAPVASFVGGPLGTSRGGDEGCGTTLASAQWGRHGHGLTRFEDRAWQRARRLPRLRAITRVEGGSHDEEDAAKGGGDEADAPGASGEGKLKPNQVQLPMNKTRSAELSFTCDRCEHRTTRMVNPNAYKTGTMFVQCAGCQAWHKIVDNLGLIYEFPKEEA